MSDYIRQQITVNVNRPTLLIWNQIMEEDKQSPNPSKTVAEIFSYIVESASNKKLEICKKGNSSNEIKKQIMKIAEEREGIKAEILDLKQKVNDMNLAILKLKTKSPRQVTTINISTSKSDAQMLWRDTLSAYPGYTHSEIFAALLTNYMK